MQVEPGVYALYSTIKTILRPDYIVLADSSLTEDSLRIQGDLPRVQAGGLPTGMKGGFVFC